VDTAADDPLTRLLALQLHQHEGRRSPHKPLLALLPIGRLIETGDSALPWSIAEQRLADLIEGFGPPSKTGRAQAAAYPFTRLRSDGVWQLDADVPMDNVEPLRSPKRRAASPARSRKR
jgi:putative restriction endonuclease